MAESVKARGLRRELEAAAIAGVDCPNCGALAGEGCRRGSGPRPMFPVDTHKKRLVKFMAEKVRFS